MSGLVSVLLTETKTLTQHYSILIKKSILYYPHNCRNWITNESCYGTTAYSIYRTAVGWEVDALCVAGVARALGLSGIQGGRDISRYGSLDRQRGILDLYFCAVEICGWHRQTTGGIEQEEQNNQELDGHVQSKKATEATLSSCLSPTTSMGTGTAQTGQ